MDMIATKAGFTVASVSPSIKRFVAMPAKLVHAGVVMRMIPQLRVMMDTKRPMGSLCKR
jgi:hypothetical protein